MVISAKKKNVSYLLLGVCGFSVVSSILTSNFLAPSLKKFPIESFHVEYESVGSVMNASSVFQGRVTVDENVPFITHRNVIPIDPSNKDIVTLQVAQALFRVDMPEKDGLLSASIDRVSLDRSSAAPIQSPDDTVQTTQAGPPKPVVHDGFQYKLPFDAQKSEYPYFDGVLQQSRPIKYIGTENIQGVETYHYSQRVGFDETGKIVNPANLAERFPDATTNSLTLTASVWGVDQKDATPVTMNLYYANIRDLYIEPRTGMVINASERVFQYYARDPLKPELTVIDYTPTQTQKSVDEAVSFAKSSLRLMDFGDYVVIILLILGGLCGLSAIIILVRSNGSPIPSNNRY
ncbi:MAG: DUF3068 domain-containing protein [Mycobacteriaceae bacterium]